MSRTYAVAEGTRILVAIEHKALSSHDIATVTGMELRHVHTAVSRLVNQRHAERVLPPVPPAGRIVMLYRAGASGREIIRQAREYLGVVPRETLPRETAPPPHVMPGNPFPELPRRQKPAPAGSVPIGVSKGRR